MDDAGSCWLQKARCYVISTRFESSVVPPLRVILGKQSTVGIQWCATVSGSTPDARSNSLIRTEGFKMAKGNKQQSSSSKVFAKPATSRNGYKRKSNRRVNVLDAQLQRIARKAMNRAGAKSFPTGLTKGE